MKEENSTAVPIANYKNQTGLLSLSLDHRPSYKSTHTVFPRTIDAHALRTDSSHGFPQDDHVET